MADKIKGANVNLYIGNLLVGCIKTASFEVSTSMIDVTTKCSKDPITGIMWMENVPNINSWKVSGSGLMPTINSGGQPLEYSMKELLAAQFAQTKVYVTWVDSGQFLYGGDAYLSSNKTDANFDDVVTFDFELTGTGKVNIAAVS